MKLAFVLVLAALWAMPVYAESDIIARWTEIYARYGMALSREELSARGDTWLLQTFPVAKREAMTLEVKVVPDDYPALLDAFLDSGTPFFVRADVSHHLTGLKSDSWTDAALAYAPAVLRLVQNAGEERARRCSGIEMLANMRYTPAGEPLFRMANDTGLERSVRTWAIKFYPKLAPQLYAGIPEPYMDFVRQHFADGMHAQGDTSRELRAWVEAAGMAELDEREIDQLCYLMRVNWPGIGHSATQIVLKRSPDSAAAVYVESMREELDRGLTKHYWTSYGVSGLFRSGSTRAETMAQEVLTEAVHRHHLISLDELNAYLPDIRHHAPGAYRRILAAVKQALAEERARSGSGGQAP